MIKIWGGHRLANYFQATADQKIGESWIISRHPEGPGQVDGVGLDTLVSEDQLPYMIKLLDTSDNLSVQVHPGDEYARRVENSSGKTECWFVLDAAEGAGIYLGFKEGVSKEDISHALKSREDLSSYLNFYPVKKNDFFFVPAGSIHAIGKDVFLAEVQQSSGITYRVWDWNRVDDQGQSRELHIDKALDVSEFSAEKNHSSYFNAKTESDYQLGKNSLVNFKDFNLNYYRRLGSLKVGPVENNRFQSIVVLEGKVSIADDQSSTLKKYESILFYTDQPMELQCSEDCEFLYIS